MSAEFKAERIVGHSYNAKRTELPLTTSSLATTGVAASKGPAATARFRLVRILSVPGDGFNVRIRERQIQSDPGYP